MMNKEEIKNNMFGYLANRGFNEVQEEDVCKFVKEVVIPGRQIIFNGQPIKEQDQKHEIVIDYIGEGSFFDVGEEESPIFGFRLPHNDIWASNLEDLKFWLDLYLDK